MSEGTVDPNYKRLLGERTGIVEDISILPPERGDPPVYVASPEPTNVAVLVDDRKANVDLDDVNGKGYTVEESLITCIGEAAERYSLFFPDPVTIERSYEQVTADHETIPYEYLRTRNPDNLSSVPSLDRDAQLHWISGERLTDGETVLLPKSLIWYRTEAEHRYLNCSSNGCATGPGFTYAITGSLLELIERDAVMRMWWPQSPPDVVEAVPPDVADYVSAYERTGCTVSFYALSSPVDVPTIGCLVRNIGESLPHCVFSCAAAFTRSEAMRDALLEAGQGWSLSKSLAQEYDVDAIEPTDDFEGLDRNFLYYACGTGHEHLIDLLESGGTRSLASLTEVDSFDQFVSRLARNDLQPICIDMTPRDIRDAGLVVTRAVVPELVPFTSPDAPPVDHPRLSEAEITDLPHPYP